ncbi:primosomal replication protein PriC [Vibrio metschnikovii]|uniref:primosomal replication protein PriC n=1 Tax=Vibrio metschnikovii TaxID=28172 RepID=UPI001C300AB2|nr:primosomal replication protein PriC [Vibrio metschnikovii]
MVKPLFPARSKRLTHRKPITNDDRFGSATKRLQRLMRHAELIDKQYRHHTRRWFGNQLFKKNVFSLTSCVHEAEQTLSQLHQICHASSPCLVQVQHLSDRLCAQLEALQRVVDEWENTLQRDGLDSEHPTLAKDMSESQLAEQLIQHQRWEQRLLTLVLNRQYQLEQTSARYYPQAQQALSLAKQRLNRCQQAKAIIEAQLINLQNNGSQ